MLLRQTKEITRVALYELVWVEPIVKIAARFHVSDVALAKACRKHKIPLPGRGYWARIAAGHTPAKPPLPNAEREQPIRFTGADTLAARARSITQPKLLAERTPEQHITVNAEPSQLHPLVRQSLIALSRSTTNEHGLLELPPGSLGILVAPASLQRAIALMDALVRARRRVLIVDPLFANAGMRPKPANRYLTNDDDFRGNCRSRLVPRRATLEVLRHLDVITAGPTPFTEDVVQSIGVSTLVAIRDQLAALLRPCLPRFVEVAVTRPLISPGSNGSFSNPRIFCSRFGDVRSTCWLSPAVIAATAAIGCKS